MIHIRPSDLIPIDQVVPVKGELIVRTRWKDLPFEEVYKCSPWGKKTIKELRKLAKAGKVDYSEWEENRGKEIFVVYPATNIKLDNPYCDGPFYLSPDNARQCVCAHLIDLKD